MARMKRSRLRRTAAMTNHRGSNGPLERDKADEFSRPAPRLAQLRGQEDQEIQAQIRRRNQEAQDEEENARRATTEILKTRLEAAQAPANLESIERLFESDSPAEHERKEDNIRKAIRKATGIYWSRYLQFKTAAENGEVGADEKATENLQRVIEVVRQKFVASDLEQTLRFSYGDVSHSSDPNKSFDKYWEYMPFTNRYFHIDRDGNIHPWIRPFQASIAHRVAAMHGFRKEDWESEVNSARRF